MGRLLPPLKDFTNSFFWQAWNNGNVVSSTFINNIGSNF